MSAAEELEKARRAYEAGRQQRQDANLSGGLARGNASGATQAGGGAR